MTSKTKIPFRTHYSPQVRVTFETKGDSLTEQQYAEESKVINKLRQYDSQGFFESINKNPAQFTDFSKVRDLTDAIEQIESAKDSFEQIPSDIRKKFNNSPSEFFDFASKESNYSELVKLGLATAKADDQVKEKVSSVDVEEKVSATPSGAAETDKHS